MSVESNLSFIESKFFKNEVEDEIQFMENQELLKKLFSKLSIKYKEIFILRFDEEKSYEEISEILKIPKSSVGTLISRVKKKLQEEYKKINK
ncbi:MAG TPA: RNA polymerase sigma factor [Candidatus Pacebacteria bacterium]|nr:RNA polymerase sigma factor [Candidatus Paceibacterota bacterium]